MIRYVFFYPSEVIGGAELLFLRLAQYLVQKSYSILIVDQEKPSYISRNLDRNIKNIDFFNAGNHSKCYLNESDTLIIAMSYIDIFREAIIPNDKTKIIIWDLHPYNLIEQLSFSKMYKYSQLVSKPLKYLEYSSIRKIRNLIEVGTNSSALFFMCSYNYEFNNIFFKPKISPIYLPIFIPEIRIQNSIDKLEKVCNEIINIAWISRLDSDKINVLYLLIDDVINFNKKSNLRVKLHIIGDGNMLVSLKKSTHTDMICFTGRLIDNELTDYLKSINIGFAMGTSVLEFAARKIPSVVVPTTTEVDVFSKVTKRYCWLYDTIGYDVATSKKYIEQNITKSFETIIIEFIKDTFGDIQDKCFKYQINSHSISSVANRLIDLSIKSDLTYKKLKTTKIYQHSYYQAFLRGLKRDVKKLLTLCKKR